MEIKPGIKFFYKGNDKDAFEIIFVNEIICIVICRGYDKEWKIPLLDAKRYFFTKKWIPVHKLPKIGSYYDRI